ncbi:basic salivary proline-rich protein 4-like [Eubalaena glacialis]|uniref:basic salivary proline-rich protein 4-like n=1 Tax=Eubalaena glacialis TaxID=27606 RepID=UPI002A5A4DD2|nr:basic salivary proline-rich protein 4-like [Eubalaena glacialis]
MCGCQARGAGCPQNPRPPGQLPGAHPGGHTGTALPYGCPCSGCPTHLYLHQLHPSDTQEHRKESPPAPKSCCLPQPLMLDYLHLPRPPPPDQIRPRCPQGTKGSQDRALELPPTYCDLGQAPPGLRLSHQKATQPETKEQVKKGEGGSHGSLAMGQPRPATEAASHSGHYSSQAPGPRPSCPWAPALRWQKQSLCLAPSGERYWGRWSRAASATMMHTGQWSRARAQQGLHRRGGSLQTIALLQLPWPSREPQPKVPCGSPRGAGPPSGRGEGWPPPLDR